MHIIFFVEEQSAETALMSIIPRICSEPATFQVIQFQGKSDMMSKLPSYIKSYGQWIPDDYRLVVLVDRDDDECHALKKRLEKIAKDAGLVSRSDRTQGSSFNIVNRIAIEELESWFFGDIEALVMAYSRVPGDIIKKAPYRNPDAIKGGTCEALERLLKRYGYYKSIELPKIEVARRISEFMDPDRNISKSFQVFRDALREIVAG